MALSFSARHLLIDGTSPNKNIFKGIFNDGEEKYEEEDTLYSIHTDVIEDDYFWIAVKYGNTLPYSPTVYSRTKRLEEDNPKADDQIETNKQFFGMYSFNEHVLYISNSQKICFLERYIASKIDDADVGIKSFLISAEEFIEKINRIEKVKFVGKNNLFTASGDMMTIFPTPNDFFGLGVAEDFSLEANFKAANKTENFIDKFKKLVKWKKEHELDSLICIGRDDKNFETIYNADTFVQKISIAVEKDEYGFYDPTLIKSGLISKIQGENNDNNS